MNNPEPEACGDRGWRDRCFHVIFGYVTRSGRGYDILLIIAILVSVAIAAMHSVDSLHKSHSALFYGLEWGFTLLFTAEYFLRLLIVKRSIGYARSFFGIIDLVAVLPTYLAFFFPGLQFLIVLRILRILRVFKIMQMQQYILEGGILIFAFRRSARKISVFLLTILTLVTIFGAVMYLLEGPPHGFTSIPISMYWAIVTVGTVGYGDIAPQTPMGRLIASLLIPIGYGIIAVPTGIYTSELIGHLRQERDSRRCKDCNLTGHEIDVVHCRCCGQVLG